MFPTCPRRRLADFPLTSPEVLPVRLEKAVGYLRDRMHSWQQAGLTLEEVPQILALQLYEQLRDHPGSMRVIYVGR